MLHCYTSTPGQYLHLHLDSRRPPAQRETRAEIQLQQRCASASASAARYRTSSGAAVRCWEASVRRAFACSASLASQPRSSLAPNSPPALPSDAPTDRYWMHHIGEGTLSLSTATSPSPSPPPSPPTPHHHRDNCLRAAPAPCARTRRPHTLINAPHRHLHGRPSFPGPPSAECDICLPLPSPVGVPPLRPWMRMVTNAHGSTSATERMRPDSPMPASWTRPCYLVTD